MGDLHIMVVKEEGSEGEVVGVVDSEVDQVVEEEVDSEDGVVLVEMDPVEVAEVLEAEEEAWVEVEVAETGAEEEAAEAEDLEIEVGAVRPDRRGALVAREDLEAAAVKEDRVRRDRGSMEADSKVVVRMDTILALQEDMVANSLIQHNSMVALSHMEVRVAVIREDMVTKVVLVVMRAAIILRLIRLPLPQITLGYGTAQGTDGYSAGYNSSATGYGGAAAGGYEDRSGGYASAGGGGYGTAQARRF
nr:unnamed protein product [Callosobruchus chinensis]